MATYISRHNPRRQLVMLGERVGSAQTYDRFYDIAFESFQRGLLPLVRLPAGQLLFRKSGATIEQSRTIRDASHSTQALVMRYSGLRLTGEDGQGALYLASLGGLVREHVHYGGGGAGGLILPGAPDRTRAAVKAQAAGVPPGGAGNDFHVYRLSAPLLLADARVTALVGVFQDLLASPATRQRFGISPLASAAGLMNTVLAPTDYSAARGLADAVHDAGRKRGITGLVATSARGDSDTGMILDDAGDGVEGLVYALFGKAGQRLDALQPVGSYASFRQLCDAVKAMPGFTRTP